MKATVLKDLRSEEQGSGFYIAEGTEVEIVRREGPKVVIRGPGVFYTCNPAKPNRPESGVCMLVSEESVSCPAPN